MSVEVVGKKAWSLDLGATNKMEPLAAVGWERGRFGLQGGAILDRTRDWKPTGYIGGTIRF